ncbi:MAG: CvpA family protein [Bacilli bacterium]|nr:hypothetical protein [Bacillota bacterium]MBR6821380.1 CvpA family protein [Bacilli bacterium]
MLMSLTLNNPVSIAISVIVILILIGDIVAGYKKGFLESGVRFLKSVIALLVAYFLKGPLSRFMYLNLPLIEFDGIFKGVSAISILIYEAIAFFVVFILILIILNIISTIIKLDEKILRLVSIIGVPNKIMGAIVGGLKSLIILYFILSALYVGSSFLNIDTGRSVGDYVVELPILKDTFGGALNSWDDITELAVEYENVQDKEQLNKESIDILLEYGIITEENLEVLIKAGKVQYSVDNAEEQKGMMEELYESFAK